MLIVFGTSLNYNYKYMPWYGCTQEIDTMVK